MSDFVYPQFSFSLIFVPLFFFSIGAQYNKTRYPNCPSYNCSSEITISYPFWRIDNNTTQLFCGYPGFGIKCDDQQQIPSFNMGEESYLVKNISYENNSIVLVDYDVSAAADPKSCPRVRHNISLETLPSLNFLSANVNLSFHFNCTGCPTDFATEIPCFDDDNRTSCLSPYSNSNSNNISWGVYSCDEQVVITTVFEFVYHGLANPSRDFGVALSSGFELSWGRTEACKKCEDSNGRCGHQNTTGFKCFCYDGTTTNNHCSNGEIINWKRRLLVLVFGSALLSIVLILIIYCLTKSSPSNCVASFKHKTEDHKSVEAFVIQYGSLTTKRYKYADIKKMRNSFQVKLGQGGFGTVFKGKLSDGRLVAVKVLNTSKASGQEFINEVASIGRTSHVNIVTLLGFCFDYQKRALVYEFMPNGSLEKFIHNHVPMKASEQIGVEKLSEIALGIARGLDYLHRGCNTRILHLDIKPHNILLDEDFCPKIADFGLAKLYSRKESIVSMLEARGTIGYIAPEVFNRNFGVVSHKSDVYSYGMLILEMVGGRKNVDAGVGSARASEIYFPYWIYNRLEKDDFLLDTITTTQENDYARKMTIVGLWCIQADPNQRPSINEVIEMLEGSIEALEVPPKPFFSSAL